MARRRTRSAKPKTSRSASKESRPASKHPAPAQPRRLIHIEIVLVLVACGLLWRRPELGLPSPIAKYGGSMLWGAMVFFCVAAVKPLWGFKRIAALAAAVAALVEFSQLIHFGWLDQFRRMTIGALLLGRTFSWWDIASYWIGIVAAYLALSMWLKRRVS